MRTQPRPRHQLTPFLFEVVRPFFRFSYEREAWVLRAGGSTWGPVVRRRPAKAAGTRENQSLQDDEELLLHDT